MASSAASCTTVNVTWNPSTDAGGGVVAGYKVNRFVSGAWVLIATVSAPTTNYADTGRSASTTYYYTVAAFDNAVPANQSALSAWSQATTPPCGGGTTTTRAGPTTTSTTTTTTTSSTTTTTAVTCTPTPIVTFTCPTSAPVNTDIVVPVSVTMGNRVLGSYGLTITYNSAVLHITAIAGAASGLMTAAVSSNPGDWTSGTSLFSSYQSTSFVAPAGTVPLARVTFHVDGGSGGAPTLGMAVRTLTDTSAFPVPAVGVGCP